MTPEQHIHQLRQEIARLEALPPRATRPRAGSGNPRRADLIARKQRQIALLEQRMERELNTSSSPADRQDLNTSSNPADQPDPYTITTEEATSLSPSHWDASRWRHMRGARTARRMMRRSMRTGLPGAATYYQQMLTKSVTQARRANRAFVISKRHQ